MKFYLFFILLFFIRITGENTESLPPKKYNDEIFINVKANYFISDNADNVLTGLRKINYESFKNIKKLPIQTKVIWVVFELENNDEEPIYLYVKERIPKMELYVLESDRLKFLGRSGYAYRIKDQSIEGNISEIVFKNKKKSHFYIKISREKYVINCPDLFISKTFYQDFSNQKIDFVTYITAGFEVSLVLICFLFILSTIKRKPPKYLVAFLMVNVIDIIYFLSRANIIVFETLLFPKISNSMVWNVLGDLNVLFYYYFFIQFFRIPRKSTTYRIVQLGVIFWIGQIFIELSDFNSIILVHFAKNYLYVAAFVDVFILSVITIFVFKKRWISKYYKIAFVGLFVMLLSAVDIASSRFVFENAWLNLRFKSFVFLQFSMVINLLCFVSAIINNFVKFEKERQLKEVEHKNQILQNELERQKSIEAERARISHDMHDDLGAGISALKLQAEFLKEKLKGNLTLQDDLDELLKTSADMNISMREMLWNLNKTNDNLPSLVQYISAYAEHFFCKSKIKLVIENNFLKKDIPISSDVRWHLFLCMKESLNNIYKHSAAKNVDIKFSQSQKLFTIEIQDDGLGLRRSQTAGNGFNNMNYRMQESGGRIEILPSKKGLYLKFTLSI